MKEENFQVYFAEISPKLRRWKTKLEDWSVAAVPERSEASTNILGVSFCLQMYMNAVFGVHWLPLHI